MLGTASQAAIFVGGVASVAFGVSFIARRLSDGRSRPHIDVPDVLSLTDAATFAHRQTLAEDLPLARVIGSRNSRDGAIAWFVRSIAAWLPAGATTVTGKQLRRYLRWARAVQ